MGGMATDPSSLSSPKAEGGSAFSPAGPNPAPRGNAAPSFIRSDFAGMDAAGPGASFGGGSPAGPVRGNRKRVRKVSEFNPSSYGKGFENRHVLTLGQDEEGETPAARGQDSSSQIMSILRRRREGEQATTQAKTPPQATLTPPPGMPTLKTPDGRTPRNLLESAQALAAWRQAQEAATPTTQPNGIQPAVVRPGQSLPGGFMPSGEGGIVKAQSDQRTKDDFLSPSTRPTLPSTSSMATSTQHQNSAAPELNIGQERKKSILSGTPSRFRVAPNPGADGDAPFYTWPSRSEVSEYNEIIEEEAARAGVDPDRVKALIHLETTQGWYDAITGFIREPKSIRPMNVNVDYWKDLGFSRTDLEDPRKNILAGVTLLKRIEERMPHASFKEIATIYNNLSADSVSDYGARAARIVENREWEIENE